MEPWLYAWKLHASKIGVLGQNRGRGGAMLTPQRTRSYFWGLLPLCHFWWKSIKKCDRNFRVRTDRQTDRRTHALTETSWIYNLSHAICYSWGADNSILARDSYATRVRSAVYAMTGCPSVRLSCLSVTSRCCIKTAEYHHVFNAAS